jgi:hypothetical protein
MTQYKTYKVNSMLKIKSIISLVVIVFPLIVFAQKTDEINSNRPGESQGAFSVGKSIFQIEAGITGIREKHSLLFTETQGAYADLNLRYGLFFEQLEFNLQITHQTDQFTSILGTESRSAVKKALIGAKFMFYDPYKYRKDKPNLYSWKANNRFKWKQFIPAVALYAGANLNFDSPYAFKNEPSASPKLILITQNQFSGGYVLVTNIIADKFTTDFPSYGYILTLTKGFNEHWSGFLENQGYKSDLYADSILRAGAAYLLNKNTQIDASISSNFKDTPSILYGGVGISWRFDKNYKNIRLDDKSKKEKKAKKEDKSKKDDDSPKEEGKKRKDAVPVTPKS